MILLIISTIMWSAYTLFRMHRGKKRITTGKMIFSLVGGLLPLLILVFLSPLATIIGAGRVVPWLGLWNTMSSLIIWLAYYR
ncbi:hypothetical protein BRIN106911_24070 [Brevibacillus invocatus]